MAWRALAELLAEAESRIDRLEPAAALAATADGALLVDIRAEGHRARDGVVPGSLHIPRTVLEWRLDADGPWSNPHVAGARRRVILICDHGYSSILAAATLVDLGYEDAADVIGGFEAWRAAGLPVTAAPPPQTGLPGMAAPG